MMFGQWHGSTAFGKWFGGLQAEVVPFIKDQFHVFTEVFASWVETSNAVFVVDTALAASSLFAPAVPVVAVMSAANVCVVTMRGRRAASPAEPKQKAFQKAAPVRRDTAVTSMAMETSVVTSTEEIFIIQTTSSAIASADLSREGVKT